MDDGVFDKAINRWSYFLSLEGKALEWSVPYMNLEPSPLKSEVNQSAKEGEVQLNLNSEQTEYSQVKASLASSQKSLPSTSHIIYAVYIFNVATLISDVIK